MQVLCCCPSEGLVGRLRRPWCCAGAPSGAVLCRGRSWRCSRLLCMLQHVILYGHVGWGGGGDMCVWYLAGVLD